MTAHPISILIADDSAAMRAFLHGSVADFSVAVYEAADGEEAVRMYAQLHPDLVLMDVRMSGMDGIQATSEIVSRDPEANVVIVTDHDNPAYRRDAEKAGARDYLLKDSLHLLPGLIDVLIKSITEGAGAPGPE